MNKKQIAVYEKRGYDNASFATGYSKEKADLCVRKIYETYRKKLKEDGYYGYGESFAAPESIEDDEKDVYKRQRQSRNMRNRYEYGNG